MSDHNRLLLLERYLLRSYRQPSLNWIMSVTRHTATYTRTKNKEEEKKNVSNHSTNSPTTTVRNVKEPQARTRKEKREKDTHTRWIQSARMYNEGTSNSLDNISILP